MMSAIYEAIFKTLSSDADLLALVEEGNIRRGLQEPVNLPSVRFCSAGTDFTGDDCSKDQMLEQEFIITILGVNDLDIEEIAFATISAMNVTNLMHENLIFHSSIAKRDIRGTFFDPIRKVFRKDISFKISWSPAIA